jgi:ADP-heptose:LPS heptosyltransferase
MNILIIKLGALGDVVMATPLIEAIRQHHHDATCHLLTTPAFAPIFAAWPALEVTALPRRGWRNMLHALRFVRALDCAVIYDLQGNDRSALWCAASGARIRVGNHTRFPYTHHPREPWTGQVHIFTRMREVLAAAGITAVGEVPRLPLTDAAKLRVQHWRAGYQLAPGNFALLHAGASATRAEKRWPYFSALGRRLNEAGITPVWIGAEAEREDNRKLRAHAGGIDAAGEFSITELAELGRGARFAVTNDSGPMHVLAAAEIPVFGLFGPSDWRRNHALGQAANVIACVETCAEFAGARTAPCLDRIPVELVWQRLAGRGLV